MDAGNINRGISTSGDRLFYSVEIEDSQIIVKERVLNIFQRILRTMFGVYSDTIWTQKKIDHLAWQCPDAVAKINDFVATLKACNKALLPVKKPKRFADLPTDVLIYLLKRVDGASLGKCQRLCKDFRKFLNVTPALWKNNFAYEHNGYTPPVEPAIGWRAFYIQQTNVAGTLAAGIVPKPIKLENHPEHIQRGFVRGNELFSVGNGLCNELYCHDLATGKQIIMFNEIPGSAFAVARDKPVLMAPTNTMLHALNSTHFLSTGESQAAIWDASKYACVFAVDNIKNGLVHAEGSRIVYYTDKNCLEVWDFTTKTRVAQIQDPLLSTIQSEGKYKIMGNVFFSMMSNGFIHAYDIVEGKKLYVLFSDNAFRFTKLLATQKHLIAINDCPTDGLIPAAIPEENQAYVYNPTTGKLLHTIQLAGRNHPFHEPLSAKTTQNHLIGIPRNTVGTVACWDLDTGEIVKKFKPPIGNVYSFALGGQDRLVITTTRAAANNIGITIWDLNKETLLSERSYQGCDNYVTDGTTVKIHNHIMYFGKWPSDAFHFWDLSTAKPIGTFPFESGYSHNGTWHFDGSRFLAGGHVYNLNQVPPKSLASRIKKIFT